MKNSEIINAANRIVLLQKKEQEYENSGKGQLFGGHVRVTYALRKNMITFISALEPYNGELAKLKKELCDDSGKVLPGKEEEYDAQLEKLLDIDAKDVPVHKISIDDLDGLQLSTFDIDSLMFMIAE